MDKLKQFWTETMEIPVAPWIVWISVLLVCICVAYYFIKLFRDMATGSGGSDPISLVTEFQKLREEGKLDDEEFSRLKKSIPREIPDELLGKKKSTD